MLCAGCLVELQGSILCESCKAGVVGDLQAGDRAWPLRVVRWALAWDLLMAALAPIGAAVEWVYGWFASYYFPVQMQNTPNGTAALAAAQGDWIIFATVGGIGLLLAILPAVLLWQRRPSGYAAQWVSLLAVPVLSVVWAEYGAILIAASALVLIQYWRKPEIRQYCQEETP